MMEGGGGRHENDKYEQRTLTDEIFGPGRTCQKNYNYNED